MKWSLKEKTELELSERANQIVSEAVDSPEELGKRVALLEHQFKTLLEAACDLARVIDKLDREDWIQTRYEEDEAECSHWEHHGTWTGKKVRELYDEFIKTENGA